VGCLLEGMQKSLDAEVALLSVNCPARASAQPMRPQARCVRRRTDAHAGRNIVCDVLQ
jgi:hypothetical protein